MTQVAVRGAALFSHFIQIKCTYLTFKSNIGDLS